MNLLKSKIIIDSLFRRFFYNTQAEFDVLSYCEKHLKVNGYDFDGRKYRKRFVIVELNKYKGKLSSITVYNDIPKAKKQEITSHFATGLIIATKYYENA